MVENLAMSIGKLTGSSALGPYDRYLDVYGLKLLVLPEVSSSFPSKVAQIYESILTSGNNTNSELKTSLLSEIQFNQVGQRIGYSGPDYYESIGALGKWHEYSGPVKLVDFIWEVQSPTNDIIAEILEHQLHTLHVLAFTELYPAQWDFNNSSSSINLAMQEAISSNYYNTEGMYEDLAGSELNKVLLQEYAFWFTVTAWDLINDYFPDKDPEWKLKTSSELQEKLPVTYQLYLDTVEPDLSKPNQGLLESMEISVSSSTNSDTVSEDLLRDEPSTTETGTFIVSPEDEVFSASGLQLKLTVSANKSDYLVKKVENSTSWEMSGDSIGTDTITGFKRLVFDDGVLALDTGVGDTAGQAYRMYQAAFARIPDMPGVAYHMNDMESNGLSIKQIATNFMVSPEFKEKYGEDQGDTDYINALYKNVLGRSASEDEVSWYQEKFDSGVYDRAQTLVNFAESPENVSLVSMQIVDGIWLPI